MGYWSNRMEAQVTAPPKAQPKVQPKPSPKPQPKPGQPKPKPNSGLLGAAAIDKMGTFGSNRFTGFAEGSWWIDGKKKGKDLSASDMAKLSYSQGVVSNSLANQALTVQGREQDIALKQSQAAYQTSQDNLGILSRQVEETRLASAKTTELAAQKTLMDEAQARTAQAEANRSRVLSQQEGRMAVAKSTRLRNRSQAKQNSRRGLLSSSSRAR